MPHRHEDWLAQARRDLKVARDSLAAQNYEWCSFQCQQAAEKTLKALLRFHKKEMRGHDLPKLIKAVMAFVETPEFVIAASKDLNAQYFRPRYPDSIAEGYPAEFYDEKNRARVHQPCGDNLQIRRSEHIVTFRSFGK